MASLCTLLHGFPLLRVNDGGWPAAIAVPLERRGGRLHPQKSTRLRTIMVGASLREFRQLLCDHW